jgi:hypothetical protein
MHKLTSCLSYHLAPNKNIFEVNVKELTAIHTVNIVKYYVLNNYSSGLVVTCQPSDPKFTGSNPAEDDGF